MSEQTISCRLTAVRDMTTAMLAAAEESRWTEVDRIDQARAKLLRSLQADDIAANEAALRGILQEALAATRAIEQRITAARDALAARLKNVHQRQTVARTYGAYA
jgi:hypothetical protein